MSGGPVRIAHLITDLDIGGAERMLVNAARGLASEFSQLVIYMTGDGILVRELTEVGVEAVPLGMSRGRPSLKGLWKAARVLRAFSPHVVQTWLYHADLMGSVLAPLARGARLSWNIRTVDMDFSDYRGHTGAVRGLLARLSGLPEVVVANSYAAREAHGRMGYRPKRWAVIPNGFDLNRFAPDARVRQEERRRLGVADSDRLVGMVGRLDPAKGHRLLLEAAAQFEEESLVFLLVGTGVTALRGEVDRRGLTDRVILEEVRGDVERVYAGLDLAVLSSVYGESFPNVLGEAMATGVPCIATDVGDARHIIGDTGIVVPRADAAALRRALGQAAGWSDEERAWRGAQARRRVEEYFDLGSVTGRYRDLYRELAAQGGNGGTGSRRTQPGGGRSGD